jgi:hypothetical protein
MANTLKNLEVRVESLEARVGSLETTVGLMSGTINELKAGMVIVNLFRKQKPVSQQGQRRG